MLKKNVCKKEKLNQMTLFANKRGCNKQKFITSSLLSRPKSPHLDYSHLVTAIEHIHYTTQRQAIQSVNIAMTLRNWLIGYYIVEYEQNGEDRAKYGENLLSCLAKEFKQKSMKGFSVTNLRLYRLFYYAYPQISELLLEKTQDGKSFLSESILHSLTFEFKMAKKSRIHQSLTDEFMESHTNPYSPLPQLLLQYFTFTHFVELIKINDFMKRAFYEIEGIKGSWSVRQLKRQIASLLFERTGLSKNKTSLINRVHRQNDIQKVEDTIRDPYILDFTGLQECSEYSENDLETALLDHLQEFLLELGNGFCFEARQKRITVDDEHDRIDLVFYHRILKCHILIDLKIRKFSYADAGQMNFYLNYFKENIMAPGDNPPVGLILCTDKNTTKVKYAISGMDNQLFVSNYMVSLPSEKKLEEFIKKSRELLESIGEK